MDLGALQSRRAVHTTVFITAASQHISAPVAMTTTSRGDCQLLILPLPPQHPEGGVLGIADREQIIPSLELGWGEQGKGWLRSASG